MKMAQLRQLEAQALTGDGKACLALYTEYCNNTPDKLTARKWLDLALDCDEPRAIFIEGVASLASGKVSDALPMLKLAAENDNTDAMNVLGQYYLGNIKGMPHDVIDLEQGLDYLIGAARGGNRDAQIVLGKGSLQGTWFRKDVRIARYWFEQARKQGSRQADRLLEELDRVHETIIRSTRIVKLCAPTAKHEKTSKARNKPTVLTAVGLFRLSRIDAAEEGAAGHVWFNAGGNLIHDYFSHLFYGQSHETCTSAILSFMNSSNTSRNLFVEGMKASIPIALGYFAVSAAYGMAAIIQGMTVFEATVTSLTNLTSAGQFAGTTLICTGASFIELILTQLIINARYFLMSISLAQKTGGKIPLTKRLIMSFGITDEIYAVAVGEKGHLRFPWFLGLMVPPIIGWTAGTLTGAAASSILPPDLVNALGLAMYGMFIAIFVPAARNEKSVMICVLLSIALSCLFSYMPGLKNLSSGYVIVIVTVIAAGVCAWLFPRKDEEDA